MYLLFEATAIMRDGVIELRNGHNHEPDVRQSQRLNAKMEAEREIFTCEHCGRAFEWERSLARHVEKRHTKQERTLVSEHAHLMRIVNPAYVARKRKAWTRHRNYREQRDLRIRCGKTTFNVHGVFMSQVRSPPTPTLLFF